MELADWELASAGPPGYSDHALEQLLDANDSLETLVEARPRLLDELGKLGRYSHAIKVQELVPIGPQELQDKLAVMKTVTDADAVRQCVAKHPTYSALAAAREELVTQLKQLKEHGAADRLKSLLPDTAFTMWQL